MTGYCTEERESTLKYPISSSDVPQRIDLPHTESDRITFIFTFECHFIFIFTFDRHANVILYSPLMQISNVFYFRKMFVFSLGMTLLAAANFRLPSDQVSKQKW